MWQTLVTPPLMSSLLIFMILKLCQDFLVLKPFSLLQTCGRRSEQRQQPADLHHGVSACCTSPTSPPCGSKSSSPKQLALEPQTRDLACQLGGDEGIGKTTYSEICGES